MKRLILILVPILLTATSMSPGQSQLEKARELLKQKKGAEAAALCQSYIQSHQRDEEGWMLLAQAQQQTGSLDAAESSAKRAVELDDELMEAYTVLSSVQLEKKNWRDAYNSAQAGLKMTRKNTPKYAPLLIQFGWVLLAADSANAALVAASEASLLDPNNPVPYEIKGLSYLKQGQALVMAFYSFEESLKLDPNQPRVLNELAEAYAKDRKYTEAAKIYIKILEKDPNNENASLQLSHLLYRAQQYPKCVAVMKEYYSKHTNTDKDLKIMYIEALLKSGQYDDAEKESKELILKEPNSPIAYRVFAYGAYYRKQYQQSIDAFNKLMSIDTLQYDDFRLLGYAYKYTKKDTLAAKTWEEIVKDTTQTIQTRAIFLGEIGSAWMQSKMFDNALNAFDRRLKLEPTSVMALINKAVCYIQMERFEYAIPILKDAKTRNQNFPLIYSNLGYCYFQMKLYEEGRKEYEMVIKVVDTAVVKYRNEIADAYRMIGLSIMLRKETDPELSRKKWEEALVYLKKSLKYLENFEQTHFLAGKCYQNLSMIKEAVQSYKRALKLNPANKEAKKLIEDLEKFL